MTREEAIEVMKANYPDPCFSDLRKAVDMAIKALEQPEQPSEIQDILNYLDTALHPIISPDHWNVYSELHDMVSMLPSVQPEPKFGHWVDDHCSECGYGVLPWNNTPFCPHCGADMGDKK